MKDNKNIEFLNTIYKTCEMGVIGINDVLDKAKKAEMRELLEKEKKEYNHILEKCEKIFASYGAEEKELGGMAKLNSKMMSEMKLMTNKEDSTIAKMMIEGTNKGIIKLNEAMNTYNEEDEEAFDLAKECLKTLEQNIEELKKYL